MSVTAAAMPMRMRPTAGPALRRARVPLTSVALSCLAHAVGATALVLAASVWHTPPTKAIYVTFENLTVPAQGSPTGVRTSAPVPPVETPRPAAPTVPAPPVPTPKTVEPPSKPIALPERTPTAPRRTSAPELPQRRSDSVGLPDRALPPRAPAVPRADQKELPPAGAATASRPAPPTQIATSATPRHDATPAPPTPLGQRMGVGSGTGALSASAGDFPFTWYLRQVTSKITEKWTAPARTPEGQQAVVLFEIARDGRVQRARVEKTSGNALYDQAALRAVNDATPFPPLPAEYQEPLLRVHLAFNYSAGG